MANTNHWQNNENTKRAVQYGDSLDRPLFFIQAIAI